MKKTILIVLAVSSIGFGACAQKIKADLVPAKVKISFAKQYPGTEAKWEKEAGKYEASFKKDGHVMSALYEANGTMTESEKSIKITALPATALAYLKVNYKGKKIKEAAIITKSNGTKTYEAEVNGKDVIFDVNGNFIKEIKI